MTDKKYYFGIKNCGYDKYAQLHILLVKKLAKEWGLWYIMMLGDSDNYLA